MSKYDGRVVPSVYHAHCFWEVSHNNNVTRYNEKVNSRMIILLSQKWRKPPSCACFPEVKEVSIIKKLPAVTTHNKHFTSNIIQCVFSTVMHPVTTQCSFQCWKCNRQVDPQESHSLPPLQKNVIKVCSTWLISHPAPFSFSGKIP